MDNIPNPTNLVMTQGTASLKGKGFDSGLDDYLFDIILSRAVGEEFRKQPDICTDGGNDKSFFSLNFRGTKLWAVANEVGGLTIMLPEEY